MGAKVPMQCAAGGAARLGGLAGVVGGRGHAVGVQERRDAGRLLLEGRVHNHLPPVAQPAAGPQQRQQRALAAAALRPCARPPVVTLHCLTVDAVGMHQAHVAVSYTDTGRRERIWHVECVPQDSSCSVHAQHR